LEIDDETRTSLIQGVPHENPQPPRGQPSTPDDAPDRQVMPGGAPAAGREKQEFAAFVAQYGHGLKRLAYLMLGDDHAAEDLAADALLAAWRHWGRVSRADQPLAYVRRILVNEVSGHFRRQARELGILRDLRLTTTQSAQDPDGAAVIDVRSTLMRLPPRRRACLVLRHGFQLTEHEVAETLGISVGTVKSQTSKAMTQFRREIDTVGFVIPDGLEPEPVAPGRRRKGSHAG
jgi:RNA polymerase sigma-70 factor (sigma-E family)